MKILETATRWGKYFATVICAFILMAIFMFLFGYLVGRDFLSAIWPLQGLAIVVLAVGAMLAISKFVFKFTKRNALGLAIALFCCVMLTFVVEVIVSMQHTSSPLPWQSFLGSVSITVFVLILVCYSTLWLLLDKNSKK